MSGRRTPQRRPQLEGPLLRRVLSRRPRPITGAAAARPRWADGRVVDYQFLGLVAVVLAVVTRSSLLAVLAVTASVALVLVAYEVGTRRYRRRHPHPAGPPAAAPPPPSDSELNRWITVVDRVLRSPD